MNCEPGDLARYVGPGLNRDALLRVVDKFRCDPGEWRCEAFQSLVIYEGENPAHRVTAGEVVWAMDSSLRPIRDPGDDAADEMLRPLPVKVAA